MIHLPFPIADRGVPRVGAAGELVAQLRQYLEEDRFVVAHCRAGIGRSSLIAAAVLVREGLSPGEAWRRIEGARGLVVPDTEGQKEWLTAFGRR